VDAGADGSDAGAGADEDNGEAAEEQSGEHRPPADDSQTIVNAVEEAKHEEGDHTQKHEESVAAEQPGEGEEVEKQEAAVGDVGEGAHAHAGGGSDSSTGANSESDAAPGAEANTDAIDATAVAADAGGNASSSQVSELQEQVIKLKLETSRQTAELEQAFAINEESAAQLVRRG
jgi:hypothetical protein